MDSKKTHKRIGISAAVGTLIVVVVVVVIVGFLARRSSKNFEKVIVAQTQQHLLTIAKTQARNIEHALKDVESKLEILTTNPVVHERIKENIRKSKALKNRYFPLEDALKHLQDMVDSLYRLDSKGIVQGRVPFKEEREGLDYSKVPGVKYVLDNHKPHISEGFITTSGRRAISVCVPIFENEQFIGILRALVYLDTVNDIIGHTKVGEKGYAQIIDDSGIMMAHPKPEHRGKHIIATRKAAFPDYDWAELEDIVGKMSRGEEGVGSYHSAWWQEEKLQLIRKLTAFAPIRLGNKLWSIGVSMGYDEISGPVKAHSRNVGIVAGLLMVVFIAAVAWFYKVQKEKTKLATEAQSAERLRSLNTRLQKETSELKRAEEELSEEIEERSRIEEQLQRNMSELQQSRLAALNMMEDAEMAKREAQKAWAKAEQANRQLEDSIERANLMAKEALTASEAKGEFLANMSHEIRTPMNAIIGFNEILADENLTDEQKGYVNTMMDASRTLLTLINDILDFSKIEAGKLDIDITVCSLGQLLNSIESLMRPQAEEKNLEFKIVESGGLPAKIRTDPIRVRQCLINLVSNAIKFTVKGHVCINVSLQEVNDNGTAKPYIRFDVEDTGVGLSADKHKLIFEAFAQADSSTTRKFGGTGLGLAVTKELTKLLGGKLSVSSEEDKGSVFSLMIPVGVDISKQAFLDRYDITNELIREQDESEEPRFSGHILVAEDSRTNQALIKSILKRLGLQVTIAEDGNEAVQKVLTQQFDLIFMDIQMPYMDGYEATKTLRNNGITTPIVALTAHAMKGDDQKCISAGCDDYLAKPINRKKLLKTIRKYLFSKSPALGR